MWDPSYSEKAYITVYWPWFWGEFWYTSFSPHSPLLKWSSVASCELIFHLRFVLSFFSRFQFPFLCSLSVAWAEPTLHPFGDLRTCNLLPGFRSFFFLSFSNCSWSEFINGNPNCCYYPQLISSSRPSCCLHNWKLSIIYCFWQVHFFSEICRWFL